MDKFKQIIYHCAKAILFAVFAVCLFFYPFTYTLDDNVKTPINGFTDLLLNMDKPNHHLAYYPPITFLPQRETLTIIELIQIISKNVSYLKKFFGRCFNLFSLLWILKYLIIFMILSSYRIINNRIPIIALKIGGHAPPLSFV